jgi:enediyne biosynthesis protein E4
LEVPGSGVALLDYDNDGWLDIYLLNSSTLEGTQGKRTGATRNAAAQQP